MRKFRLLFALTVLAVSACGPVTPVPAPTALPTSVPASPVPTATVPTLPDIVPAQAWHSSDLEPITQGNVERLEQIGRWGGGEFYGLAVSPDQKKIAVYTATQLFLLDSYSLDKLQDIPYSPDGGLNYPDGTSQYIAFSPDGKYLAIANTHSIELWDMFTGPVAEEFAAWAVDLEPQYIEFNPDGEFLTAVSVGKDPSCDGFSEVLALYNIKNGSVLERRFCYPTSLYNYSTDYEIGTFSPDGSVFSIFVTGSNGPSTQIVRIPSLDIVDTLVGYRDLVPSANGEYTWKPGDAQPAEPPLPCGRDAAQNRMLANDGKRAVINPSYNTLEVLDLSDCRVLKKASFESGGTPLFSPDGRVLASWRYGHIEFFSMLDGAPLSSVSPQPPESGFNLLRFNADGSLMVTGISSVSRDGGPWPPEYELSVWDVRTGNKLKTLVPATSFLYKIFSTPDKNVIAAVDLDGLHFWDLQKGVLLRTIDKCGLVAFDQTGNQMAAAFRDRIEISDFRTGKIYQTITVSINELPEVFFNRDASKLAAVFGRKLEVFDIDSGKLVYQVEFEDYSSVVSGNRNSLFASYDSYAEGIPLWDFEHNQPVRTLLDSHITQTQNESDFLGPYRVVFTPDGQMLLSLYGNHIRFWDVNTGVLLDEVVPEFRFYWDEFALSPDGRLIAITSKDGLIHILGVKKP